MYLATSPPDFLTGGNLQKYRKTHGFGTFWLVNVLGATAACNFSTIFRHVNVQKWSVLIIFLSFWVANVLLATAACKFSTSQLQKVVRDRQFFNILTSKCASRYSGVQIFHIPTSKSGPNMQWEAHFFSKCASRYSGVQIFHIPTSKSGPNPSVFWHFDFKMCFSLQRRANFLISSQQWPPHPPLYRGYFSTQPTHKSLQNTAFRDFATFSRLWSSHLSRICIFFLAVLLFQLSILSEVRLLNFLR